MTVMLVFFCAGCQVPGAAPMMKIVFLVERGTWNPVPKSTKQTQYIPLQNYYQTKPF